MPVAGGEKWRSWRGRQPGGAAWAKAGLVDPLRRYFRQRFRADGGFGAPAFQIKAAGIGGCTLVGAAAQRAGGGGKRLHDAGGSPAGVRLKQGRCHQPA